MKHEFDIHKYREIEETYNQKLIYINGCILRAEKISVRQTINELKFISLQIREYCSISKVFIPQNIPTGWKGITVTDAAILKYVNEKINYYSELKININVANKPDNKTYPALPDCFIDKNFFKSLLTNHQLIDYFFERLDNDTYKWKGTINQLAGLAHRLKNRGKLIKEINSGPDLAKVFCPFFNIVINEIEAKQFQPARAKTDDFYFIT